MYQLLQPKFKYTLFVDSESNNFISDDNKLICFADSYEIKEDGSITFYQTGLTNEDKKFKLPVLSYPHGKWFNCAFLDVNDNYPIFNELAQEEYLQEQEPPEQEQSVISRPVKPIKIDEEESINSMFNMLDDIPKDTINIKNLPPNEFKEKKGEWIFDLTGSYLKSVNRFDIEDFMQKLQSDKLYDIFNVDQDEVVWIISNFIRDKMISPRKFSTPEIQKVFGFILKEIMKRQWEGKVSSILDILHDKEETQYVDAIDLAVWMVQNGY